MVVVGPGGRLRRRSRTQPDAVTGARARRLGACSSSSRSAPAARAASRRRSAPRSRSRCSVTSSRRRWWSATSRVVTDDAAGRLVAAGARRRGRGRSRRGQGAAVLAALAGRRGHLPRRERRSAARAPVGSQRARGAAAPRWSRGRRGGRRDDERARAAAGRGVQPLYGPGSAGQFRAHAVALDLPFEDLALPNLVEDVDTLADLERVGPGGARGRGRSWRRSRGEGRVPLRGRWRREARRRAPRRAGAGRADRDRQRRRRRRGARPARLTRPRLGPLRARGVERRRARVGARRRDLADARIGEGVGRRGLVHARRPRPRAPSRPHAGASVRRAALRRDRRLAAAAGLRAHRPRPRTTRSARA